MKNIGFRKNVSRTPRMSSDKTENRKKRHWLHKLYSQREKASGVVQNDQGVAYADNPNLHSRPTNAKRQELTQAGINEATEQIAEKKEEDRQMVNDLIKKSNRTIIRISSIFPWELFPDSIDVEESRITFKFNQFLSSQTHSVEIKDIANVLIETSLFFATIKVVSRIFIENEIKIDYLDKKKAIKVQQIIEGLRTFAENDINTSNYEIHELIKKIGEFHSEPLVQ